MSLSVFDHLRKNDCQGVRFLVLQAIMFFAPLITFVLIIIRLNEERCNGIQALIEVAGGQWYMIDLMNFLDSLVPSFIFSITATIFSNLESNRLIVFMCLFFHYITMIALAFICCNFIICGPNVVCTALFIYVGFYLFDLAIWPVNSTQLSTIFKGLLPHMPYFWIMHQILGREYHIWRDEANEREGVQFTNWMEVVNLRSGHGRIASVKMSIMMLLIQITFFLVLHLVFRMTRLNKFGKALTKHFWVKDDNNSQSIMSKKSFDQYFENLPTDLDIAIEIIDVKKTYPSRLNTVIALNNISLNIYHGEVTVIVGHNGSGKTTLLSIIAGIEQQSSGQVHIEGLNSTKFQIKEKVAFCPQQSTLFPVLTVQEHLMFFSKIGGDPVESAETTTERVLTQMGLNAVQESLPSKISIGLQRRLQIGCSLCIKANLLLLDDPTAEIDIAARKDLYQILSKLRGERTIVLTTNFLEEADMFADRIAALHRGILCCYATPKFLKSSMGNGSRVKITSFQQKTSDLITKTIRGITPDATLSENIMGSLVYNVPPGSNMEALIDTLESNRAALDIESLELAPVSLEELFIKLCSDGETDMSELQETILKNPDDISRIRGFQLLMIQMKELFKRQIDYTNSRLHTYIILHLISPILVTMFLFMFIAKMVPSYWHPHAMDENGVKNFQRTSATYKLKDYDLNTTQHIINKITEFFPELQLQEGDDENETLCNCMKRTENSKNIFNLYVDPQDVKLKYNQNVKNSAFVGLHVLSNIIAAQQLPQQTDKTITMRIGHEFMDLDQFNVGIFSAFMTFIVCITVMDDVGLPCRERTMGTRYYHIMAGCPPWLYWLVTLSYQIAYYALIFVPSILIITAIFDMDDNLKYFHSMKAYFICLLVCGISFYTLACFLSQCFNELTAKMILLEFMILGLFAFLFLWGCLFSSMENIFFYRLLWNTRIFNPVLLYTITMRKLVTLASFNKFCIGRSPFPFIMKECLDKSKDYGAWFEYFSKNERAVDLRWEITSIFISSVVFIVLVMLVEYQIFGKLWHKYRLQQKVQLPYRKYESKNVASEKDYVKDAIAASKKTIKELVLVSRVWKIIFKLFGEKTFILKDLNYSVPKGECFCFVGLNGAGKSSVFKVMTRQFLATKGVMYADGYFSHQDPKLYLKGLGYCPHSLCLDTFRNSSNNMRMLMHLRGIHEDVENQCKAWVAILGLERFQNVLVDDYSYGMGRRLSLGAAMCRGERVLLLDQPMSGVDISARHKLWAVIEQALSNGCSVVHTSHNMEVIDHMCKRLAILDGGEMADLRSLRNYKEIYAPGHSVVIKLLAKPISTSSGADRVQSLKDFMFHEFDCFLREEYLLQLHFIIINRLRFTIIYKKLTSMANEFRDIVEDYSAYDANFEDALIEFVNGTRSHIVSSEGPTETM